MASELGIAAALGAVLLRGLASEGRRPVLIVAAIAVVPVGRLAHLLLRRPTLSFSEGVRSAAIEPRVAPLLRRTPRGILRAS